MKRATMALATSCHTCDIVPVSPRQDPPGSSRGGATLSTGRDPFRVTGTNWDIQFYALADVAASQPRSSAQRVCGDERSSVQAVKRSSGQVYKWSSGQVLMAEWSSGQAVKWSSGQAVKWQCLSGQVVKRSSGQVVKWTSGQAVKWSSGSG